MPRSLRRLLPVAIVGAAGLLGCGEGTTAPPLPIGGALVMATYHLHEADSLPLPAKIHERRAGVALEESIVDSARLSLRSNYTYEQRIWMRILLNGIPDRVDLVIDEGSFAQDGTGFRLTSSLRAREFTLSAPRTGEIETLEQMLFLATDPPITLGSYRLTRP